MRSGLDKDSGNFVGKKYSAFRGLEPPGLPFDEIGCEQLTNLLIPSSLHDFRGHTGIHPHPKRRSFCSLLGRRDGLFEADR